MCWKHLSCFIYIYKHSRKGVSNTTYSLLINDETDNSQMFEYVNELMAVLSDG